VRRVKHNRDSTSQDLHPVRWKRLSHCSLSQTRRRIDGWDQACGHCSLSQTRRRIDGWDQAHARDQAWARNLFFRLTNIGFLFDAFLFFLLPTLDCESEVASPTLDCDSESEAEPPTLDCDSESEADEP
jgi:hypothetical protein